MDTVREVVDLIVELGIVDQSTVGQTLQQDELDKPLSYYGHIPQRAVLSLLDDLGIRFAFDYKTFRGIEETDDDERLEWYEEVLQTIASCTKGLVTITNVRLVEDDEDWELQFDCNGETEAWPVYPGDEEEDLEAALTFATYLSGIPADSLERFCSVDPPDEDYSGEAVFGDPEALNRLGAHFGLSFTP
ncbi:hypothetical protein IU459_06520 [Nocardia amamiensis]|uniref:SUKH-4 immunity protein of toxin-antitoxin system n=1 Tax=Nocardia amamiensis TaxID=404578 RepID=A0ABS0CN09_9NOCA|nr:hypothetical protein [Nocardia amamiensis]MBF6297197.1 hypothetical protein [Nocardia amamiensis]